MIEKGRPRPYSAGIDIRNPVGTVVGDVAVESLPGNQELGGRLALRAHTGRADELALVQLWLEPIELRELAGAMRLVADHVDQARRRAREVVASGAAAGAPIGDRGGSGR
jgi:hypothetical protein